MSILICPVCAKKLTKVNNTFVCCNHHSFDCAKEGYVNLLTGSKNGDLMGDSKASAAARREFLDKGYYKCLKDKITPLLHGTVLDICCGEGYYDSGFCGELYGFDISKNMVRLAAKRKNGGYYFAANLSHIPVESSSVDIAIHMFAPFNGKEFARVIKDSGTLYSVIPGKDHLSELKQILYDTPYQNDEYLPLCNQLNLIDTVKIKEHVFIPKQDIYTLFSMTPYYYRTSNQGKEKLKQCSDMNVTVDFIIARYKKAYSHNILQTTYE